MGEVTTTATLELDEVIAQTPEPLVRAILLALCDDPRVRTRALQYLARLEQYEAEARRPSLTVSTAGGDEVSQSPALASASCGHGTTNPKKRKKAGAPRICAQCDMIFTDEENEFGACRYHSGEFPSLFLPPTRYTCTDTGGGNQGSSNYPTKRK